MTQYKNYFVSSKNSRLINGHLNADELYQRILKHNGKEAYACYFDLDEAYLKNEYDTNKVDKDGQKIYKYFLQGTQPTNLEWPFTGKSFAQYEGSARPSLNMISFDFDSSDINESFEDVKKFCNWLDVDDNVIFFSGSKGFHVLIHFDYFGLTSSEHLPNQLKDLAKFLKKSFPTLDDSIYNYNRKFRVPFTKHDKSGLYKTLVSLDMEIDEILEMAKTRIVVDFLPDEIEREVLECLKKAIEDSKRITYEVEKDNAGTKEKPSLFESWDDKLCIKKMLNGRCEDIGRNNAALRIVNDYYRTGKTRAKCEIDLMSWASQNELPLSEISGIITNIYERGQNYNFGCQDECKSLYCSKKCLIFSRLAPDKRPVPFDLTEADKEKLEQQTKLKTEFVGVTWLMENIFSSFWDEEKNIFAFGHIVKQGNEDLFYYKENYWQHLTDDKIAILKTKLNAAFENKLSSKKLADVFKMFFLYVAQVPDDVNLFSPRNDMANFLDGTLHLERNNGKFELVFKNHNPLDFCSTIIDQNFREYQKNPDVKNQVFEEWLLKFLNYDQENFNLIQEMFGASIMPKFPQFFVLVGRSSTGKSTTIKMLKKLHKNEDNISGVSPDKFHGFNMSSMVGKLLNIVSDIKTNCRIDDDIVKQVDDQDLVRIERKKRDDIYARLPALHIFGANKMPQTNEGYSGAMSRRFSIINFDIVHEGARNVNIVDDMFNHNPLGLLAFAMGGLKRLVEINNGEFTKASKSVEKVNKWTKQSDIIWAFIDDVIDEPMDIGGKLCGIVIGAESKYHKPTLWTMFQKWQEDGLEMRNQIGRMKFYILLEDMGFVTTRRSTTRFVQGIGNPFDTDNEPQV